LSSVLPRCFVVAYFNFDNTGSINPSAYKVFD
jgi:hypothetical protein